MNKRLLFNTVKYALAFGLLAWVVRANWGEPGRVATHVDAGPPTAVVADLPHISGTVASYAPGDTLVVDGGDGPIRFLVREATSLPEAADALAVGQTVTVREGSSRGLAYVWQRHAVEGVPINYGFLIAALVIAGLSVLLTFYRWYLLVRALDLPFELADALRLGMVGFFFNTLLPGSVGGDIVKAVCIARGRSRRTVAVATVLMDRAIAVWAMIGFAASLGTIFWAAGLLHGPGERTLRTITVSAATIFLSALAVWSLLGFLPQWRAERFAGRLSRLPAVGGAAAEFWRAVWMYRWRQGSVARAMLLTAVGQVGFAMLFYCGARTLTDPADPFQAIPAWYEHFLLTPVGLLIQAVPLFPGGAGIGELGFGGLYGAVGCSVAAGVLASLVMRFINCLLGTLGYFVYLQTREKVREAEKESELVAAA